MLTNLSYNPQGPLSLIASSASVVVACRFAVSGYQRPMFTPDEMQPETHGDWGEVHTNTGKVHPRGRSSLGMQSHAQYHGLHLSTCTNEPFGEDLCARCQAVVKREPDLCTF